MTTATQESQTILTQLLTSFDLHPVCKAPLLLWPTCCLILTALASPEAPAAGSPAALTLYYENRAPFMVVHDGELGGTEGQPASDAFKTAGIEFTLSEAPVARQIEVIGKNLAPSCAVGLYWTAVRAGLGKYTRPIFRSLPQDVVVRSDNPKVQGITSMTALLADPTVSVVLRNSYSYGPSVDAMLGQAKARLKRPSEDSHGRIKMVLAGMADATLFTQEEAEYQIKEFGAEAALLSVRRFNDTPPGEPRHIYCSKSVDDAIINKLNDTIKQRP